MSTCSLLLITLRLQNQMYIGKPVLRGHLWDKEKWPYKTGDLLKDVQFMWNFYDITKKCDL